MTTREELIRRLEGGEVGFDIGIEISNALFDPCPDDLRLLCVRASGGSLDSALALVARVRPGWYWMIDGSLQTSTEACLTDGSVPSSEVREEVNRFFGRAPTECGARLAALLEAEGV